MTVLEEQDRWLQEEAWVLCKKKGVGVGLHEECKGTQHAWICICAKHILNSYCRCQFQNQTLRISFAHLQSRVFMMYF
jgi:hypothetical protein